MLFEELCVYTDKPKNKLYFIIQADPRPLHWVAILYLEQILDYMLLYYVCCHTYVHRLDCCR